MKILPHIPAEYQQRFRGVLNSAAVEALFVFPPLLTVCFLGEAWSQAGRPNRLLVFLPLALAVVMCGLSVWVWKKRTTIRNAPRWLLALIALPYINIVLNFPDGSLDRMESYLALLLVAISVFVLPPRECFFGAGITGLTMVAMLIWDPRSRFDDLIGLTVGAGTIAGFSWVCRQRSLRHSFLQLIAAESAAQQLQMSQEALDLTANLILWADAEGRITYANEATSRVLNVSRRHLPGNFIYEFVRNWNSDNWTRSAIEHSQRQEVYLQPANGGEEFPVEMYCEALKIGGRTTLCFLASDVTQQRLLEQEIERVQKLQGLKTLAGGIAHDFNNLLVPILANASAAQKLLPNEDRLMAPLRSIEMAGERAAGLIDQLLIYTGNDPVIKSNLCVSTEVDSILTMLRGSVAANISITTDFTETDHTVRASSAQLQQVLLNLVVNAGQAIGDAAGEIHVAVRQELLSQPDATRLEPPMERRGGSYVVCEVRDTGSGMSPEVQAQMFDPFFTSKEKGRGLGLSAVLGIVRSHNGGMRVDSKPGVGTRVFMYLPTAAKVPEPLGLLKPTAEQQQPA